MSSTTLRERALLGSQVPRVWCAPSAPTSAGPEAVKLAELAGLHLFPWQRFVCEHAMRQHADGRWAAFEVLLLVSRQNGKGTCLEVFELYALFVLGANVYHTAHLMKTSRKAFKRLWSLIERTPQLRRRVMGKPKQTAEEIVITLVGGAQITFMARSGRAGRGLDDCDVLVLDEALFLEARMIEATIPTMSTRDNPIVIYASSAGVEQSTLLRALRERMADQAPGFAGFEWSIDPEAAELPEFDPLDVDLLAQANPSLGALISLDYVRGEHGALAATGRLIGFLRERMGVFDADPAAAAKVIPSGAWRTRGGGAERPVGPVGFAVAGSWPDAEWASIGVAGWVDDELAVQVIERRPGTAWVRGRIRELMREWENLGVAIDAGGPVGSLVEDLQADAEEHGFEVITPTIREVAHASSRLRTAVVGATRPDEDGVVEQPYLRHHDQADLDAAAKAASRRTLGNAWTFAIRDPDVDIGPLECVSLAAWVAETRRPAVIASPVGGGSSGRARPTGELRRMGF